VTYDPVDPEELGAPRGRMHGMLGPSGARVLFVSGQDASGPEGRVEEEDLVEQFRIALDKTVTVVREAGGGPEDIGRLTVYVTDVDAYRGRRDEIREAYRSLLGKHRPATALVEVRRLGDPAAVVELEATALIEDLGA
jgi:enamine deaminase RidA (YjgF/YER057c/UK114 family)